MALRMEVGLATGHIVLDGDPAALPKKGHRPEFSAQVYCGQTIAWINMPLSTEVNLGLCDIVFDEDLAPPEKRARPHPIFRPCAGRPRPWPQCVRWGPSIPMKKGAQPPPNFRPVSVVTN